MYSWALIRRWCPQLGHTLSARTNRSLISMWPHSSHFSQASAGISSFTRSDVRGLRSFLNQAIRATVGNLKATIWEGPPPGASPDRVTRAVPTIYTQPRCLAMRTTRLERHSLSELGVARLARLPRNSERDAHGDRARKQERAAVGKERQRDSGDRQQIHRHPHVLDDVREQQAGGPEHAQAGVRIRGAPRDAEQDEDQRDQEGQRDQHADEPQLLPHHGKDEVGELGGQEREPFLRALREPLAQE